MFRNATMLVPLAAGLIALLIADTRHEYVVSAAFIGGSAGLWLAWRVVDTVVTRGQRKSLER